MTNRQEISLRNFAKKNTSFSGGIFPFTKELAALLLSNPLLSYEFQTAFFWFYPNVQPWHGSESVGWFRLSRKGKTAEGAETCFGCSPWMMYSELERHGGKSSVPGL